MNRWLAKRRLMPFTPYTVTTHEGIRELIEAARRKGYALLEQQLERRLRGIAVPIRNRNAETVGAISSACRSTTRPPSRRSRARCRCCAKPNIRCSRCSEAAHNLSVYRTRPSDQRALTSFTPFGFPPPLNNIEGAFPLGRSTNECNQDRGCDRRGRVHGGRRSATAQTPLTYSVSGANLTLYGDVDYYLNYQKSSSGSHIVSLQDGAYLRTRIGLRGDKSVAEGYTVKFQAGQGLNDTTGAQADATRLFDRQLWAGLATPIGEFRVGRQNTAVFYKGSYIDNTTRTLGSVINAFGVPSRYD